MMNIESTMPQAVATIFTETGNLVFRATNESSSNMDNDIISVNTGRQMGADAPTFSIVLVRRHMWHKYIGSNDLVLIEMCRPPEILHAVFVGLVDDCRKTVTIQSGKPQRSITVTGRGLAKALVQFDSGIVPESEVVQPNVGWIIQNQGKLAGSSCSVVLQSIWDNIVKKFVNYSWTNGKKLLDNTITNFSSRPDLILADDTSISNWQGSLWALMKEIAESPFYELYWEVDKSSSKAILTCRPTPFNPDEWNHLPKIDITDDDVVYDNTGRSDVETYSVYSVGAKLLFSPDDPYKTFAAFPLWNKKFADKYGIRRLHAETMYLGVANQQDAIASDTSDILRTMQVDLYNWNIKNNSMYNGQFYVKGSSKYMTGYRLMYKSEEDESTMEYYITGVDQEFVNFDHWVTKLTVTRGCLPTERFTSPVGDSTVFSGLLGTYDPENAMKKFLDVNDGDSIISNDYVDTSGKTDAIVQGARDVMNSHRIKYVYGANDFAGGKLDCSAFTQYVFKTYGSLSIGRTTFDQVTMGTAVSDQSKLASADLVLFHDDITPKVATHVGIYSGDGKFIHCSSSATGVIESSLSEVYYKIHYLTARRVVKPVASAVNAYANATLMNRVLRGKLKGRAADFIAYANKYGVDPVMIAAISMQETGGNISSNNNPGGLMKSGGGLMSFSNIDDGIAMMCKTIASYHLTGDITEKIAQAGAIYCPVGASNDPTGLNRGWIPGVIQFYKELSGQ